MLYKKQIKPPFKPKIESEADTSNFDPMFTNATPIDSLPNTSSAPLSDTLQQNFEGFTYTNEMSTQVTNFSIKKFFYLHIFNIYIYIKIMKIYYNNKFIYYLYLLLWLLIKLLLI